MKKALRSLFMALLLTPPAVSLASGGPDAYGYTWMTSLDAGGPAFNWIDITSRAGVQTVTGLADDNSAASMINIGFNFHYYWNDVSQLRVGSNGWLCFNASTSNVASCFPSIPTAGGGVDNYLAPLMGDLNFTGAGNPGQVKYWTNSLDTFIISYINVPFWTVSAPGWTGSNSFQVILCSSDSSITYQYGALSGFTGNAACIDLTVGIENSSGQIGLQVHTDALPPTNYVIKFDYPTVPLISIQDVLPQWNANNENYAEFVLQNIPINLRSDIRNSGNAAVTTTINMQANVLNAASTSVYSSTGSIPTLAAGDDSVYTFSGQWTPTPAGQYSFMVTTTNSQDINASNNTTTIEYDVVNACAASMPLSHVTGNAPSNSINWNGGANDDGVAVYFNPPVFPYTVSALQYYISSNVGNGFIATVYDDNGPNGGPGTILFTTTVPSTSVVSAAWNTVNVTPAITLPSGGFYVAWYQGGTNIFIGSETTAPYSHRNYEILDNGWAALRYNDGQDVCIRTSITGYTSTPTANFTSTNAGPLAANFTDATTGLETSWSWDFGDGNTSTTQNPSHTYASAGTYNVCLIANSPCGADTFCQQVTVCQMPGANYTSSTAGSTVNFTDMSTNVPTSWYWDFGDGNTSTAQNPSHTYAANGGYTVCLVSTNNCGSDTTCQSVTICVPGTTGFSATDNLGTVTFTDATTGGPVSWMWDFGDSNTSTSQNPTHTYATGGTYNVCLIADNGCGADTMCQQITVCLPVASSFTTADSSGMSTFSDMSTGSPTSWAWDFGDGGTSTAQNPVYLYVNGGVYTVCLITTNACSADTICMQDTIFITGMDNSAAAVLSVYPNPAQDQLTVQFSQENDAAAFFVYDMTGRLVLTENKQRHALSQTIDIHALPAGMYELRLQDSSGGVRFVKK